MTNEPWDKKTHGLLYYLNRCDAIVIVYIFSGESGTVTFRMKKYIINNVVDWFGRDIEFFDASEDEISAKVYVNLAAMRKWAMQYAVHMRVLTPQSLVDEVKADIKTAMANYEM